MSADQMSANRRNQVLNIVGWILRAMFIVCQWNIVDLTDMIPLFELIEILHVSSEFGEMKQEWKEHLEMEWEIDG